MYPTLVGVNMILDKVDKPACYANLMIVRARLVQYPVSPMDTPENSRPSARPPRLLDQLRDRIRLKHYSRRTELAYVQWVKRYIHFHGKRHPAELGKAEVEAFLTSLAVDRNVAASTQSQALSALLFLYREVLNLDLSWLSQVTRAKKPARLPTVLTRDEVQRLFKYVDDPLLDLVVRLLYGTGMRVMECVRLRAKDSLAMRSWCAMARAARTG